MSTDRGDGSFEDAFDSLFLRARRLAYRVLGDEKAAEDVAAEALARAYANWARVAEQPWRDGWVLRVATNLAIDASRSRRRRRFLPFPEPPSGADQVATRLALVAALSSLPRRQREAVALRYLGGFSEAEVASALGISTGSVKTHLHRGVNALRAELDASAGEAEIALI